MLLEGLKVVEMATWVAGPGCAGVMADWGASVVKVESATGDPTRGFFSDTAESPGNPVFTMENRGKRSVVLNTSRPEGRSALIEVLRQSDIFVTNLRPDALRRARLDYDSLREELPTLIYASISGYGQVGPDADLPAFDITAFWSRSGVAASTIPPDQSPFPCRPGFGDHVTALATLSAVLAALYERASTGRGRFVETSLLRTGAYAIGWDLATQLRYGEAVTAQPRDQRPGPISGYFRTSDDRWVCVVPRGPSCFSAMMDVIDRPDVLNDPRFQPPIEDLALVRAVRALVDEAFAQWTLEEVEARLRATDLIWSPMATLHELSLSAQAEAAGCFETIADGWGGQMRSPAAPARFPEGAPGILAAAPKLGEHTSEVLREVGLTEEEVTRLIS